MKTVLTNIKAALVADVTLAAYVKQITTGHFIAPRDIFPCINIDPVEETIDLTTIGKTGHDDHQFTVQLQCCIQHMDPDIALKGKAAVIAPPAAAIKGILEMIDDVLAVVQLSYFNGAFSNSYPAKAERVDYWPVKNANDTLWVCSVMLTGGRRENRIPH